MNVDMHLAISAVSGAITLLLAIIAFFARERLKDFERQQDQHAERLRQLEIGRATIEAQYVATSQAVRAAAESMARAMESIGELRAEIGVRYTTREEFAIMDGKLDKVHERISTLNDQLGMRRHAHAAVGD